MTQGGGEIYGINISPQDEEVLDTWTRPRSWDYGRFRMTLIALGVLSEGNSIPGRNRPDSIHIQGLRRYINELVEMTKRDGREHARAVFVDSDKRSLVVSGRITVGTESSVKLDVTRQPGREKYQRVIGSFHTHPSIGSLTAHGLSGQDYRTFLKDPEQQFMMIGYGDENLIMVLKTSVTPNHMSTDFIDKRVQDIEHEFEVTKNPLIGVIEFNKTVCTKFGLTMYIAGKNSRDLMKRVEVTR